MQRLRDLQKATGDAGFPPLSVYRKVLGPHGTMVTVQRWDSVAAYDASRDSGPRHATDNRDLRKDLPGARVHPRDRDLRRDNISPPRTWTVPLSP